MKSQIIDLLSYINDSKEEIFDKFIDHIALTSISLVLATIIGISLGLIITRQKQLANNILGLVGVIQTIPSVALLGFMLPIIGIGATPAIIALTLYALLPIIRNTYTGIEEVEASIKEAAKGMGMSNLQILTKVELPLATPVIFAGIRTATVITVGYATIAALIASGGLGEFIFRGIALNNVYMILAGAIPAALLAIGLDFILGFLEKNISRLIKPILIGSLIILGIILPFTVANIWFDNTFKVGVSFEFMERDDGYKLFKKNYGLELNTVELQGGLLTQALQDKSIDMLIGSSTDGRGKAYDFTILEDDLHVNPPYYATPLVRKDTLRKYPELERVLNKLGGKISQETMMELNYRADYQKQPINEIVKDFLSEIGFQTNTTRKTPKPDIIIGSKSYTEQYILAEIMAIAIENETNYDVELRTGLAGTFICFNALINDEIDLYPEYTSTGLMAILEVDNDFRSTILYDKNKVLEYVREEFRKLYNLEWLTPFGFNNTYVLTMRNQDLSKLNITSISDLKEYLLKKKNMS